MQQCFAEETNMLSKVRFSSIFW